MIIKTWVILVSGFTQGPSEPTGTELLWRGMREHSNKDTCIAIKVWDDDAEGYADYVKRNSAGPRPRILIGAYSWGAGHFFTRFAQRCTEIGLVIDVAVLADPVYRSRLLSFRWLALTGWPRIRVPESVKQVRWTRQRENSPMGHDLFTRFPQLTDIHDPVVLRREHNEMDDSGVYHQMVALAFQKITQPKENHE